MTPEAFEELVEQHYGKSNPAFVKAMKDCIAGTYDDEDFQTFMQRELVRFVTRVGGSGAESGGKIGAPRK